jgi:hypothetical protein
MSTTWRGMSVPAPPYRRLRAFAFDPILGTRIETYEINEVTIRLPWETGLAEGPVDEYLEVVDYDPASQVFYPPVNLNDPALLAQDGLAPAEGSPQFHQQMVYAVARTTIAHFERALGRRALWSPARVSSGAGARYEYVDRLRIYPHALREANAYYSPAKKALLFGYFPASFTDPGENLPGGLVFTCLSHDIVAHETTHALLDGLHRRFIEPTNVDVWALHEAFADIVALFQHFTYPDVLRHAIAQTHGDLRRQNLLAELAYQFGQAIGHYGALRSALGRVDRATGTWTPHVPDPAELLATPEPHARGAILVAAIFDAFLTLYRRRVADLIRVATGGTGVLPPGDLHPDLVERLAQEAAKTAQHVLHMCIRALDYCPPVDINYGDYLRALITADADLVTDDRLNYRLAVLEAARRRGIYPWDIRTLSTESLLWEPPTEKQQAAFARIFSGAANLRNLAPSWGLSGERREIYEQARRSQSRLHRRLVDPDLLSGDEAAALFLDDEAPLYMDPAAPPTFYRPKGREDGPPALEVHSVRPTRRVGPDNQVLTQLVVEITQRRRAYLDPEDQRKADAGDRKLLGHPDFIFRGGCTLVVDLETAQVRTCIYKRIRSERRLEQTRAFLGGGERSSLQATYFGDPVRRYLVHRDGDGGQAGGRMEPFALLHRSFEVEEMER